MKKTRVAAAVVSAGLLLASMGYAQQFTKVGQAGATFLKIEVGARANAMGGAQIAAVRDASALYWNPAGIGFLEKTSIHFTHNEWLGGLNHNFFAVAVPLPGFGAFGVAITSMLYGDMEVTTLDEPDGTGETFGATDFALALSFARQMTYNFTVAISAKYVRQQIWDMIASGLAWDIGTVFRTPFPGVHIGASITNFGQNLVFRGQQLLRKQREFNNITTVAMYQAESFQLPLQFKLGLAYEVLRGEDNQLLLCVDGVHPNDNREYANLGVEYGWNRTVYLRAGYKLNTDIQGLSAGGGLNFRAGALEASLEYAYSRMLYFDDVHRFSIGFMF